MWIDVEGRRVLATTGGRQLDRSQPLVMFVHGAGNDRTAWQLQTRYFAHHGWTVVAPDLPGHGGSEGPAPDSIGGYAEWLASLIRCLGWERANVCGHSMGSLISLELAARHPQLVERLALIGTTAEMGVHPELQHAADHNDHLAYELITGWSHSPSGRLGGNRTPGVWMAGTTMRMLERNRPGVLANDLAACASYDGAERAARQIGVPVLLLLGSADLMTRPKGASPLEEAFETSETVVLSGVGHLMMTEDPDGVIDNLARFLSDRVE